MRRFAIRVGVLSAVLLGTHLSNAAAQLTELARQIPSSANAVAIIDVQKLMASPVAVRDKWAEQRNNAFASGFSILPPDAKHAVLAMQVDLQMWVPLWEAALLELDHEPVIERVAAMTGGTADVIQGRQVVGLQDDAFVVKLDKTAAAFMAPANRQFIGRWLREIDARKGPALSPYLSEGLKYVTEFGTPVILALDLEDAIQADEIHARLEQSKDLLSKYKIDPKRAAQVLAGIRGITLGITFDEKPFGKVKVDFRDELTLSPEAAKAALLHSLRSHGAMIDEFEEWSSVVKGKQVTLEGHLTSSGMRRLSSLFDRPPSLKPSAAPSQSQAQSSEQKTRESSQTYFKRTTELLEDLRDQKKGNTTYTMAQLGVWMDKYAKKIDQLSVLNVDPELVDYGAHAADTLRAAYNAIRTGSARSRIRQVNTPMQYNYYSQSNIYGYTYREGYLPDQRAYQQDRTRVKAEERVTSANSARDLIQELQTATADIRRKMTQKYQVEF